MTAHEIDFQPLLRPCEELLVLAAFKKLAEGELCVEIHAVTALDARYEYVLLIGHAVLVVIHNFTIAVERESVLDVAANAEYRYCLVCRNLLRNTLRERPRGVRTVEHANDTFGGVDSRNTKHRAHAVHEQNEHHQDPARGGTETGYTETLGDNQNQERSTSGGQRSRDERVGGRNDRRVNQRHGCAMNDKPGQKQRRHGHGAT